MFWLFWSWSWIAEGTHGLWWCGVKLRGWPFRSHMAIAWPVRPFSVRICICTATTVCKTQGIPSKPPCHRRGQMFGYFTFIYGIYVAQTIFNKNLLLAITSTRHPRKSVDSHQGQRRNGGILAQLRLKSNSAIRNTKNGEPQSIIWRTRQSIRKGTGQWPRSRLACLTMCRVRRRRYFYFCNRFKGSANAKFFEQTSAFYL